MNDEQLNESNSEGDPMNFDPDNPFYARLFQYRFDSLTSKREKERDLILNTRSSNFLINRYPPYGIFRAADELTRDKIVLEEFDSLSQQKKSDEPDPLNMIRLAQTADILNAVLNETEEKRQKIESFNAQFIEFQKKSKESI